MMKLHWSPRSPFVRKVMIAAAETGVIDRLNCVRTVVGGIKPHLELMRENPLGMLPTLVLDDGTVIYDSTVICEYFDTLHEGPKLFPAAYPERLTVLRRHALGNGMLDILVRWLSERFRPAERQSPAHMELWRAKLRASIDALESEASDLATEPFSVAHISIGVALAYLDFRFDDEQWREHHPHLTAWHAEFNRRPCVANNPPVDDR